MSREVDRLLAGLATTGSQPANGHRPEGQATSWPGGTKYHVSGSRSTGAPTQADHLALWVRALLGVVLGGAITQWPYPHGCGWPLSGYLGAVATIVVTGVWIAIVSWKTRGAVAHVVAIILVFWGVALAAAQVLPRIGYAVERATWGC